MPNLTTTALDEAHSAIDHARRVRAMHAKRTDRNNPQRTDDIRMAAERLLEAMKPIRSEISSFSHRSNPNSTAEYRDAIRGLSRAIQSERRKLWKMRNKEQA